MRPKWEPSIYAFKVYSKILHTNIWQKYCKIPVCYSVFPNTAKFHTQVFHVESQTSHVWVVPKQMVFPLTYSWYHFLRTPDHTPHSSLILPSLLPLLVLISHSFLCNTILQRQPVPGNQVFFLTNVLLAVFTQGLLVVIESGMLPNVS